MNRVDILARSNQDPVPSSVDIFDTANDSTTKGTLAKDVALGNLLRGQLTTGLPATPVAEMKLFFGPNAISDLWVAVTWSNGNTSE